LFSCRLVGTSLLQGLLVLAAVALRYEAVLKGAALPAAQARAAAFTALVAGALALVVANRAHGGNLAAALRRPNPALARITLASVALMAAVLGWAPLRRLFHFDLPATPGAIAALIGASVAIGVAVLLLIEAAKALGLRIDAPTPH
ncbi:MAG: cation transporting ATPase C-terminal domain-containing protein, partial [Leptothrix sp. (in: b-proteobacteria)]